MASTVALAKKPPSIEELQAEVDALSLRAASDFSDLERVVQVAQRALQSEVDKLDKVKDGARRQIYSFSEAAIELEGVLSEVSLLSQKAAALESELGKQMQKTNTMKEKSSQLPEHIALAEKRIEALKKEIADLIASIDQEEESYKKMNERIPGGISYILSHIEIFYRISVLNSLKNFKSIFERYDVYFLYVEAEASIKDLKHKLQSFS